MTARCKIFSSFQFAAVLAALLTALPIISARGAECAGKSVAQCADVLAEKVDELQKEHADLSKRLVDAKAAAEVIKGRVDNLERQLAKINEKAAVWYKDIQYDPILGQPPFNGVDRGNPKPTEPPSSFISCAENYVAVGLYLDRTSSGLNDARLLCRKLSSGIN